MVTLTRVQPCQMQVVKKKGGHPRYQWHSFGFLFSTTPRRAPSKNTHPRTYLAGATHFPHFFILFFSEVCAGLAVDVAAPVLGRLQTALAARRAKVRAGLATRQFALRPFLCACA